MTSLPSFNRPVRSTPWRNLCLLLPLCVLTVSQATAALPTARTESIGGRLVESITVINPKSNAVVILETGSRGTIDTWAKVLEEISKDSTVFAYNRPGYANSEVANTPRDGATIVEELHQVLQHKGLKPPYVLVGHSLGGLYMQLFAKTYPNEVQGIVLVDSVLPRIIKRPEDFPLLTRIAKRVFFSRSVQDEIDHIFETGEAIVALPGIDEKPMIQIVNAPKSVTAVPVDFGVVNSDAQTIAFVRKLYPKAKKIVVDSDHQMHIESPAIVASAVREMVGVVANQSE